MSAVVVAFHAHPDDEALLTGGTLARLAAAGHRAVIVVACDGVMGAATEPGAGQRLAELNASAAALGVERVVCLGYADSGHGPLLYADPPDRTRFARADVDEAAGRLATVLREVGATVLLSYDPQGGYGHRDHVRVHEVADRATNLVPPIRVLEATLPREPVVAAAGLLRPLRRFVRYDADTVRVSYTPRAKITHRVDVRQVAARKRAALAAHRSQRTGGGRGARLLATLVRLPVGVFGVLLGREWFVESRTGSSADVADDVFGAPLRLVPRSNKGILARADSFGMEWTSAPSTTPT